MKINARVSKLKFEKEVDRLGTQAATLGKRGVIIHRIHYPLVEVIFIPGNNLVISFPGTPPSLPPGFVLPPGPYMVSGSLQGLSSKAFGVRISLDDFDQRAPSVVFCDPFTWEELTYDKLHRGNHIGENKKPFNVLLDKHPHTKKPFLCMRGIREYHEHPQHTGDDWMQYRKYSGLFSMIDTIWNTCVHNANPLLLFQSAKQPKIHWIPAGAK